MSPGKINNGCPSSAPSSQYNSYAKELEDELMKYTTGNHHSKEKEEETCLEAATTIESSSSFGESDDEAEAYFRQNDSEASSSYVRCSSRLKMIRNKVSEQWRKFIGPVQWRCKWAELQMIKLESQAKEYERHLERYRLRNQFAELFGFESLMSTRKRRRRAESTTDLAAYMANHNLFSYDGNAKKGSRKKVTFAVDNTDMDYSVADIDEDSLSAETRNQDDSIEQIFGKIEHLQKRVKQMKSKFKVVVVEELPRVGDGETTSRQPAASPSPADDDEEQSFIQIFASVLLQSYNDDMGGDKVFRGDGGIRENHNYLPIAELVDVNTPGSAQEGQCCTKPCDGITRKDAPHHSASEGIDTASKTKPTHVTSSPSPSPPKKRMPRQRYRRRRGGRFKAT